MKRTFICMINLLLAALLLFGCSGSVVPPATPSGTPPAAPTSSALPAASTPGTEVSITILHTNDVHGAFSLVDAISAQPAEGVLGHDVIASVRAAYEAKNEGPVFLLDAGDATQGIYFVTANTGEAAIDIMNAAGYDAMALGNHEFDYGWFRLQQLMGMADFDILSQLSDDEAQQAPNLRPYTVIEKDGVRLGVFGLTTPETQFKSNGGFGRYFGDVEAIIAHSGEMVRLLREEEQADFVVCLAHLGIEDMGYGTSYDLRDQVEGIDLIIDGHSHTALAEIDNPPGKTPITSTGSGGRALGIAKLASTGGTVHASVSILQAEDVTDVTPDAQVAAIIGKWSAQVAEAGSEVVAQIPFDITVERENERTRETVMGNLTTDAMRTVSGADVAIQNGGSIRDQQLAKGDVTKAQLVTVFPYGNVLQVAEVRGSVLLECLEHSVAQYPEASGGFMQVSGMAFGFDATAPEGQRVTWATVGGAALDPAGTYTLCTNDFIAVGGDLYTMLIEPFSAQLPLAMPEHMSMEGAVIWYLAQNQQALSPQIEGRIIAE